MKKISILEDLLPLFPTSPFKIYLDVKNNKKNVCILSESLTIQYSDELQPTEQEKAYTSSISAYICSDEVNANFDTIYDLLMTFFDTVCGYELKTLGSKYIESVNFESPFGFTGRDQSGNYTFILNFSILYKMQGG